MTLTKAEEIRDMDPEQRRELLAKISFPEMTKPQEEKMSKLSDDQVLEALTTALWLGMVQSN